jgi:ankyrin repeat protein
LSKCAAADVKRTLDEMPIGLNALYERVFANIGSDSLASRVRLISECIAFSKRPLSVEELADVLTADLASGNTATFNLELRASDPEAVLLKICPSIIQVVESAVEASAPRKIVQFIHASVLEYLLSSRLPEHVSSFRIKELSAHISIAKLCLGAFHLHALVPTLQFASYAAENWFDHVFPGPVADALDAPLSDFLHPSSNSFSGFLKARYGGQDVPDTPLYWAAVLGALSHVERLLLFSPQDLNTRCNRTSATPLHAATFRGHRDVVLCLLQAGRNPVIGKEDSNKLKGPFYPGVAIDLRNKNDWSVLDLAVECGHIDILKLLLDHGANVGARDKNGWTVFHFAAQKGYVEIVRLLLDRGSTIDACNDHQWTALHGATRNGHVQVVQLLLDRGAMIDARANNKWTALLLAAHMGHVQIVHILLERKAAVDARHTNEWTALHFAAQYGHFQIASILLARGAAINAYAKGWTALHHAAWNGHIQVVQLLLDHGATIDARDTDDWTVLHISAQLGHVQIAELLLDPSRNVTINARSNYGYTPLHFAAQHGHVQIVQMLLAHGAQIDDCTNGDRTALQLAAIGGHFQVVQLLLHHGAMVYDRKENSLTALHFAVNSNHVRIAQLLLDPSCDTTIEARDKSGWTPLHFGAQNGSLQALTFLLDQGALIDALTMGAWTALHVATRQGHIEIVRVLLARGAAVGARSHTGWTPLHNAAAYGCHDIVKVLLKSGADPEARSSGDRQTALIYAASGGHVDAVRVLLDGRASIASSDGNGYSALDHAVSRGHAEVTRLLLEHGAGGSSVKSLPRGYAAIADVARHADALRPVPRSWRDGEAEDVARALEEWNQGGKCALCEEDASHAQGPELLGLAVLRCGMQAQMLRKRWAFAAECFSIQR